MPSCLPVAGTKGNYLIYSDGRVFSVRRNKFLKPQYRGRGYLWVNLGGKVCYVHRLVLEAFVGLCPSGMVSRHLDGDMKNNCAENLAWGTETENAADRSRHGRTATGERCGTAKLTWAAVREIRKDSRSCSVLAKQHGVTTNHIWKIKARKLWLTEPVALNT